MLGWAEKELEQVPGGVERTPLLTGQAMRAAVRMELALLGRVRVNRPRPPEHHNAWYYRRLVLLFPLFLGASILQTYLLAKFSSFWLAVGPAMGVLLLIGCLEVLFSRKLSVADATPTGQERLDKELEWMLHPGCLKGSRYFFTMRQQWSREELAIQRLYWLVGAIGGGTGVLLAQVYSNVGIAKYDEVWPSLQERLRSVLIGGQTPDPQTAALLLLATFYDLRRFSRLPRKDAIIYRLFAPEEQPLAHQRLTRLLKAAPEMTAQLDPDLYDTLLFIRDQTIDELKSFQQRGRFSEKARRVMAG
jgi:hypothetical protein